MNDTNTNDTNTNDLTAEGHALVQEAMNHPTWCPEVKAGRVQAGVWLKGATLEALRGRLRRVAEAEAGFCEGRGWLAEEAAEHAALHEVAAKFKGVESP